MSLQGAGSGCGVRMCASQCCPGSEERMGAGMEMERGRFASPPAWRLQELWLEVGGYPRPGLGPRAVWGWSAGKPTPCTPRSACGLCLPGWHQPSAQRAPSVRGRAGRLGNSTFCAAPDLYKSCPSDF